MKRIKSDMITTTPSDEKHKIRANRYTYPQMSNNKQGKTKC